MKRASPMGRDRTVQLALGGLWLRAFSIGALAVYTAVQGGNGFWLPFIDFVAATVLVALWTPLMGQYLRGRPVLITDPRRTTVARLYPWLIAYEGALWLLFSLLPAVSGFYPEVQPVASAVQLTVSGAGVAVSFLIYLTSLQQMANPADTTGRRQLGELCNVAAALAAALIVLNVVPMAGMPAPGLGDRVAYGLANAVEAGSWLLLRWALVRTAGEAEPE